MSWCSEKYASNLIPSHRPGKSSSAKFTLEYDVSFDISSKFMTILGGGRGGGRGAGKHQSRLVVKSQLKTCIPYPTTCKYLF